MSAWIAHRSNRSSYTLDTVAAWFAQSAFSDALRDFNKTLRRKKIDEMLVNSLAASQSDEDRAAVRSLRYLLNYFEFISVGVLDGELDERIVAKTLRGNLLDVYNHAASYITDLQKSNPRTLENFSMLRRHYQDL